LEKKWKKKMEKNLHLMAQGSVLQGNDCMFGPAHIFGLTP
jgi:hypothetical protein